MLAAVIAGRLVQFTSVVILFGTALFFLYGLPPQISGTAAEQKWSRPLLRYAAFAFLLSTLATLIAQTAVMADSVIGGFRLENLAMVLTNGQFGLAIIARLILTIFIIVALFIIKPSYTLWSAVAGLGVFGIATFALTGHGNVDEGKAGLVHLGSDIFHLIAAAIWLGALAAFAILIFRLHEASSDAELSMLYRSLRQFSGIGSAAVIVLFATGLINSLFLVGSSHMADLVRTPYGLILSAKVALFAGMLALAAANRFLLTPRFGAALMGGTVSMKDAVSALRRSLFTEASIAFLVLVLVSVLGMLEPPSSQ